ncbi:YopX family protein [Clostridium sp. D53t1_180928_C8]|uniref:YopX family protein n=1 Tax=Clostridium sp. D53t1_180928_C8 TaxID=2787101 RepID=UPI0018A9EC1C|nr:YopX family protein [Clostridium sp. D53t1_180928_C8]
MEKELKFKIYNKVLNKCFKVTRIDYIDEVIYYFDKEKNDEDIISFNDSVLLMPTGIYDASGREIFEGDVITYQENSFTYKKTAEVIYQDGCFMTKQLFPKNLELKAQKENMIIDDFKDLLCVATSSISRPIKIIGNIFTYKLSKNNCKIKIEV